MRLSCRTQIIAPKRETASLLKTLRVKFYAVAGGFPLGELRRSMLRDENEQMRIYADFNGLRISPRNHERSAVALDTFGSLRDLSNAGIRLKEETPLVIFDWSDENEDLEGHCKVYYDWQRQFWWAELDEQGILDVPRDEKKLVTEFLCLGCRKDLALTNCFSGENSLESLQPAIIAGINESEHIYGKRTLPEKKCPFCETSIIAAIAPPENRANK